MRVVATDPLDITAPGFVDGIEERLRLADLVLFQNCLNEFPADQAHVRANAEQLVHALKPGAVLLMADLNNYPTGRECLDLFAQVAAEKMNVLVEPGFVQTVNPAPDRPAVLDANFFVDGEYPRSRPFEFRCLGAKK